MLALLYIGISLPSTRQRNRSQGAFLLWCLVPLIISATALATYAALTTIFVSAPFLLLRGMGMSQGEAGILVALYPVPQTRLEETGDADDPSQEPSDD